MSLMSLPDLKVNKPLPSLDFKLSGGDHSDGPIRKKGSLL